MHWVNQVRQRLAQHLAEGSTDQLTSKIHRYLTMEIYCNPSRDRVAKSAPFPILPSSLLQGGHVVADTHPDGTPLLVHRDHAGQVKAYLNQCRHRGVPLVKVGESPTLMKGSALVCPYHAWTYDVNTGNLKGVPGEKKGFPCLDKKDYSLPQIPVFEAAGGIWLGGQELIDKGFLSLTEVHDELSVVMNTNDNDMHQIGFREWELQANWQLLVETFLESYHVSTLHSDTLGVVAHSNVMVTDILDSRNFRMTVALKNFDAKDSDDDSFFGQTSTTYLIFPHTAIALFKRFVLFLSIVPSGSSSRVRAWGISRDESDMAGRDFDLIIAAIQEDWDCAQDIQCGLNHHPTEFTYGRYEGANVAFLRNVGLAASQLDE